MQKGKGNQAMKTPQEIEFIAGGILAEIQKRGCTPHEATEVALTLVAYVIDRHTRKELRLKALSAAQEFLRTALEVDRPS